jgi:hypothetical protein
MSADGYGYFDYGYAEYENTEKELTIKQNVCYHEWSPILLLTSTVWDCKKCKAKKEEVENAKATNSDVPF